MRAKRNTSPRQARRSLPPVEAAGELRADLVAASPAPQLAAARAPLDPPELTALPDEHAIPEHRMTHIERINGTHPNPAASPGQGDR